MSIVRRPETHPLRALVVLAGLMALLVVLGGRAIYLQVFNADFLKQQGNARTLRVVEDNSHRGMILDRNGEPLAISTPVDSVWANPAEFGAARERWPALARILGLTAADLAQLARRHEGREFMYLKRHVPPSVAEQVTALGIPGVALTREYRRYYPAGVVAGHVLGFTNIDDRGQEGLELAYDRSLRAIPGRVRVLKDRFGNVVETVESVSLPVPGRDLVVSIDRRMQYLVYRELKAAVEAHGARGASAVVLDARSGEVLAMVNEPGFNPNNRVRPASEAFRNRAVTDVFEPGSTLKPFTVAAALESGRFRPDTPVETSPGYVQVGPHTIRDGRNYGKLTVARVIEKSSNVGATRIALALNKNHIWQMLSGAGFGAATGSGLPGEASGVLNPAARWVPVEQATISFGYGMSVTALQLARAYGALANDGKVAEVTLLRRDEAAPAREVMTPATARAVRSMLELAVSGEGTGAAARVVHYRVAGKTGTTHKLAAGGYSGQNWIASFAGFAPASSPRLVMVIMVDDPSSGGHFGGQVAAPVFARAMTGALRLLDIPPDGVEPPAERRLTAGTHPPAGDRT